MGPFENTPLAPSEIWPGTEDKLEELGLKMLRYAKEGATGLVWKANDKGAERVVAVKIIKNPRGSFTKLNGISVPAMNYFRNERQMLAKLQDCDAVPGYYYSVAPKPNNQKDFQPFHVMEYVKGAPLLEFIRGLEDQEKTVDCLMALFQKIIQATSKFHRLGVVHRDLAPNNILIGENQKVWLIDVGESCPEVAEHTRIENTTVGEGTVPDSEWGRKTMRHDIYDLCRVGFAIFTNHWPDPNCENKEDWLCSLDEKSVPKWISDIILKGMSIGNQNLAHDPTIWNNADELEAAIASHYVRAAQSTARAASRRRVVRSLVWKAIVAGVLLLIGVFVSQRIREQSFYTELARFKDAQVEFSNKPLEERSYPRVQIRINQADELKENAIAAKSSSDFAGAVNLLKQATGKINEAGFIVDDFKRLVPLVAPLQRILAKQDGWNQSPVITRKLSKLGERHQKIQQLIAKRGTTEDVTNDVLPSQAWSMLASLQPDLVDLIEDNQQAFEIEALLDQLTAQCASIAPELREEQQVEFGAIEISQERAQRFFKEGDWDAAVSELNGDVKGIGIGAIGMLEKFLHKFESDTQRKQRLATNAALIATQVEAADSLRKQVREMQTRLQAYKDALVDSSRYKKERDDFQKDLVSTKAKLGQINKERSHLAKLNESNQSKLTEYEVRLKNGAEAWKKQLADLANTKTELQRNVKLVERLKKSSGDAELVSAKGETETAQLVANGKVGVPAGVVNEPKIQEVHESGDLAPGMAWVGTFTIPKDGTYELHLGITKVAKKDIEGILYMPHMVSTRTGDLKWWEGRIKFVGTFSRGLLELKGITKVGNSLYGSPAIPVSITANIQKGKLIGAYEMGTRQGKAKYDFELNRIADLPIPELRVDSNWIGVLNQSDGDRITFQVRITQRIGKTVDGILHYETIGSADTPAKRWDGKLRFLGVVNEENGKQRFRFTGFEKVKSPNSGRMAIPFIYDGLWSDTRFVGDAGESQRRMVDYFTMRLVD